MRLLLDTQLLVWIPLNDQRISDAAAEAIRSAENSLYVSAVTAFEFADLQRRKRVPVRESIDFLAELIGFSVLDLPAEAWRLVDELPDIHRDPVDRMLIAHSVVGDLILITPDANTRRYKATSLW